MRAPLTAALFLALVLNLVFFPVIWGNKTLLLSSRDAPSVMPTGAFHREQYTRQISRTPDPGAPAWTLEPWAKIISEQYWHEHEIPLWNPYAGYGKPLAATQQAQPFYPLTILLSLHVNTRAYDFFIISRLFVAGFLMFLFGRLFLQQLPSLAAAATYMLSGYFILLMNMPHLSVEVLAPGILWTFERILRGNNWASVSAAAAMIFCAAMGGMPEALFLVLAFGTVYFLFRLVAEGTYRAQPLGRLTKLISALGLGFGLSAPFLLPFVELARVAQDSHQAANLHGDVAGLIGGGDLRGTVYYLVPMLFGPVGASILSNLKSGTGMWAYWGVLPCLLAIMAMLRAVSRTDSLYPPLWRSLTGFFAISLALMLLKRFGNPIVNWIGGLPIADMVLFVKYDEPIMALCVAMLAGMGFALVSERRLRSRDALIAILLTLVLLLGLAGSWLPQVLTLEHYSYVYYVTLGAGILVILAVSGWLVLTSRSKMSQYLAPGLLALLIIELFSNFILPSFYIYNRLPSRAMDPYAGAPYVDFLKGQNTDYSRIFGRENILYPNWAGVFDLADVRSLDAMEYRPYFEFVRAFLLRPGDEAREHGDLADRFTGWGSDEYIYDFATAEERRFLALSSVKYLISMSEYGRTSSVLREILAQHQGENLWGFGLGIFPIGNGRLAEGMFQHPPSNRIVYKAKIDPSRPIFAGSLSMGEAAHDRSDGVGFTLEIKDGDKIERLFHTNLNPRDVPADRVGHPFRADLTQYAGQEIELLFSTDPGPSGNNAFDWAGWARLGFEPKDGSGDGMSSDFKEIYGKEVSIYQVTGALPRAALYSAAELLPEGDVLARLKAPSFDPERTVILARETIPTAEEAAIHSFTEGPAQPVRAAQIITYEPSHVRIEAETSAPAILMLNDTAYPGWRASINGVSAPIMRADYLFRGVRLPAGKSTVDFDYVPNSFRLGAGIFGVCFVVVIALPLVTRRRWSSNPVTP
jgi:hypothetical protein